MDKSTKAVALTVTLMIPDADDRRTAVAVGGVLMAIGNTILVEGRLPPVKEEGMGVGPNNLPAGIKMFVNAEHVDAEVIKLAADATERAYAACASGEMKPEIFGDTTPGRSKELDALLDGMARAATKH